MVASSDSEFGLATFKFLACLAIFSLQHPTDTRFGKMFCVLNLASRA